MNGLARIMAGYGCMMKRGKRPAIISLFRFLPSLVAMALCACHPQDQKARISADQFFGNDHRACQMVKVGALPVREFGGHIFIDGVVKNMPVSLEFDTGAMDTILTQDAVKRLGLVATVTAAGEIAGLGGAQAVGKYRVHFLLNGVEGDWERYVLAGNLGPGASKAHRDGLIGPSFFVGHDIDFDFPDNKIILYFPQHDCSHPSVFLQGPVFEVPLAHPEQRIPDSAPADTKRIAAFLGDLFDASPKIMVAVGGKMLVARVDSGAPHNVLFLSGAQKIGITPAQIAADKPTAAFGIGPGPVPAVEQTVAAIDVGDLEMVNVPILVVDQNLPDGVDMLLGLDFFRRIHVWISYSSSTLILQYPPSPSP